MRREKRLLGIGIALICVLLLLPAMTALAAGAAEPAEEVELEAPSVKNIAFVQPYSELTYYAVALTRVEITYNDNVDLSGLTADSYHLADRGYLHPEFGEMELDKIEIDGQTVTLYIHRDTTANENNVLIYEGADKAGDRSKDDIFGVHACFSWYRQLDGQIVESARAFQFRNTELKIWHEGESPLNALCQSNDQTGEYLANGKIAPTEIQYFSNVEKKSFEKDGATFNYSSGGLMTLEDLDIKIPSSSGIEGDYVKAYVSFPEGYDPNEQYPLVMSLPGNNASYWDIVDENGVVIAENPYGPTFFNGSTINWYAKDVPVIAIYMSHCYYSQLRGAVANPLDLSLEGYNYVKDDMAVIDYFIENYGAKENHIVLTGDSRGTKSASNIILAYPGRISTFLCMNGSWGGWGQWGRVYTEEDYYTAGTYGLSVWCLDGELDFDNITVIPLAREQYAKAGMSEEEIADKLRISCMDTRINGYWADTDHSVTKLAYWYLMDTVYYGPCDVVDGELVYEDTNATTYHFNGKLKADGTYTLADFEYTVYPDTLIEWVLSPNREIDVTE